MYAARPLVSETGMGPGRATWRLVLHPTEWYTRAVREQGKQDGFEATA
jgi:hypothetical protein